MLVLGIDTCGPTGSVALARLANDTADVLGQAQLEGRTYSATLVAAIADLLNCHGVALPALACIVVVNGPGSFTGVRVGLSVAKGLAEGANLPVVAVSRLEVLAAKARVPNAALDAHRHEVFLSVSGRELLAGADQLANESPLTQIAVSDAAAAALVTVAWPHTEIVHVPAPTASDALALAVPRIRERDFCDVMLLDGHYLRRSDAEIFGDNPVARR